MKEVLEALANKIMDNHKAPFINKALKHFGFKALQNAEKVEKDIETLLAKDLSELELFVELEIYIMDLDLQV